MTNWTSATPHFLSVRDSVRRGCLGWLRWGQLSGKAPKVKTGRPSPFDLVCLLGEFARRCDDKRTHLAQRAFGQPLQNRQQEGSGLAGAGLRQPQYVAPFEHDGDSLMLNRGGRGVASRFDARADARVEQMGEPKSALIIVSANGVFRILRQRPGHPCLATTFRFTASVRGADWMWPGLQKNVICTAALP